jgi:AIR synthase related protein, N-terminal domain
MAAEYTYRVSAWWTSGRTGLAKCESSPNTIHFSEAAELGGLQGRWTPEQLLLCALASSFTTTFADIGDLAVNGTVNDLAMCGARPLYLSAGFILEEGLEMETLRTVVASMQQAAARANVKLVTGDTKVVDKGKGDGIFINTSGIGVIEEDRDRPCVGSARGCRHRERRSRPPWHRDSLGARRPGIRIANRERLRQCLAVS